MPRMTDEIDARFREAELMKAPTVLAIATSMTLGLVFLTGCSAYDSLVHKQSTSTFANVETFNAGSTTEAAWIPTDATEITVRTSTLAKASDAVILLDSGSALLGDCAEVERYSAPAWVLDDAPDPYKADSVFVCGDWSVMSTETGWYGWTPNSDEERSAASAK
jgi:hypothetical protein